MKKAIYKSALIVVCALLAFSACTDDEDFSNENFSSNEFRVLKVTEKSPVRPEEDNRIEPGENGIAAFGLVLEIVFSHPVDADAIANNLSVSGGATYTIEYNPDNSTALLSFELLEYQTEYTISLAEGTYGTSGATSKDEYSLSFTTRPFVTPSVTLSSNNLNPEEGSSTTITATLAESTTDNVQIDLAFAGSATVNEDYTVSATSIVVPLGDLSASVTLEIEDDIIPEGAESINVTISNLVNGVEDSPQELSFGIVDNDVFTDLTLKGVMAINWSTEPSGNSGKAVHLRAKADIADLSIYGIGVANNGGGTDGIEFTFPAIAVAAGEDILLAREDAALLTYFSDPSATQFEHVIQTDEMNQNGNDAIELFSGTAVIETFGDINVDGVGQPWEYSGSWAYNFGDYWYYGGVDCAAGSTTTQDSDCIYPLFANALQLQGVMSFESDPSGSGTTDRERAIHLRANKDIDDLSIYGIGIANNGGGSDGREMDLPAISVSEGDHILFIRDDDASTLPTYLGNCINQYDHLAEDGGINFNGDDGVELYENLDVIEVYGNVIDDGTGLFWEYTGSWAYKEAGDVYTYGGPNCAEFAATNASSSCPYAFCE